MDHGMREKANMWEGRSKGGAGLLNWRWVKVVPDVLPSSVWVVAHLAIASNDCFHQQSGPPPECICGRIEGTGRSSKV